MEETIPDRIGKKKVFCLPCYSIKKTLAIKIATIPAVLRKTYQ